MSISDNPRFQRYSIEPVFYMAHPLASDDRFSYNQNMQHVVEMMRFFYSIDVRVIAPYHTMCLALDNGNTEHQRIGLEVDLCVVRRLGNLILVGHKLSSGMTDELHAAIEANSQFWNFVGFPRSRIREWIEAQRGLRNPLPTEVRKLVTDVPRLDVASK